MSRVGAAQMKKLLDLLSEDGVLVNGKVSYVDTNKCNFWKGIAAKLNAVEGGVYKNAWKWCKMWADWKTKTKKKANILLRRKTYVMEHPSPTFTTLELRLLKMIDYPIEDKAEAVRLAMGVSKVEPVEIQDVQVEYLNEECIDTQSNKEKTSSDDDDNTAPDCDNIVTESRFCDVDEVSNGGGLYKACDSTDTEKVKMKETTFKKKKSFREHRLRTELLLEKQKARQKTEELRLRAIELKLKGEELRLKEMEMNKINYLTNIEDEKLKCFREISTSLKELVERTKNGNIRL
ncbi:uncharacterized protein ACR2FA_005735 [Aphomia sociella]